MDYFENYPMLLMLKVTDGILKEYGAPYPVFQIEDFKTLITLASVANGIPTV